MPLGRVISRHEKLGVKHPGFQFRVIVFMLVLDIDLPPSKSTSCKELSFDSEEALN